MNQGGILTVIKKILSLLLALTLCVGCACFARAADGEIFTKQLNVISFNVDGLPIPSFLSSTKRPAAKATRILGEQVKAAGCDILCAQEDFNYHGILSRALDMPYRTRTSGPAVIGDGLNVFSKYPIYNVERVAWDAAYGVFDCGSDELTPKGILCCTVEIADGAYIDVYTLHADAWEDDGSMLAKAAQFDQLLRLIEENSADRAVLLTGDFNVNYSIFHAGYRNGSYPVDLAQKLIDNFVANGFSDAWIEAHHNGDYTVDYAQMREQYGCEYPRVWDTLDHVFYRSGKGVTLELQSAEYDSFDCDGIDWPGHLSDHAAVVTSFTVTVDQAVATVPDTLKTEPLRPVSYLFHAVTSIAKTLWTALVHLPDLFQNGIGWIK